MTTVVEFTWTDIQEAIQKMAKTCPRPEIGLIAIARGGLIPAGLLMQHWRGLVIAPLGLTRYSPNRVPGEPTKDDSIICLGMGNGEGWYIVDDLVDEGITMRRAQALYPAAKSLVLLHKEKTTAPDYWGFTVHKDLWVKFPWEEE